MSIRLRNRVNPLIPLLIGIIILSSSWTQAEQTAEDSSDQRVESRNRLGSVYLVGVGDLLEINVFGFEQFHKTLRISGAGTIRLPLLEEVVVDGLTTSEIEAKLTLLLKEAELFKNPDVKVQVQEFRSQTVFVLGTVGQPGQYHLTRPSRLIDVLSLAGGIREDRADGCVILERYRDSEKVPASPSVSDRGDEELVETIKVDLEQLLEEGDLSLNHWVRDGDVVTVPERPLREFFIIGEVIRPGAFEINPDEQLLLTQALARAGGPMKTAKLSKGILARYDSEGVRQEISLNVDKILKGKQEDVAILPDDVIFIPGSTFKSIAYGLAGAIPRTVSETITTGRFR